MLRSFRVQALASDFAHHSGHHVLGCLGAALSYALHYLICMVRMPI